MAQWANLQQIKRFVNPTQLYITCEKSGGLHLEEPTCEKSGGLHLEEPGLTAGRQAG